MESLNRQLGNSVSKGSSFWWIVIEIRDIVDLGDVRRSRSLVAFLRFRCVLDARRGTVGTSDLLRQRLPGLCRMQKFADKSFHACSSIEVRT